MSSSEDNQPTSRLDILERQRKRQQKIAESMDWRSSNNNRMDDYDANFKRIVDARPVSKTEPVDEIPEELQPLTAGKAAALGWTDNEWKRQEAIRMFKVNQYMDTVNANKHADAKRKSTLMKWTKGVDNI